MFGADVKTILDIADLIVRLWLDQCVVASGEIDHPPQRWSAIRQESQFKGMNLQRIIGLKNPDAIGARLLNRFTRAPQLTRGFGIITCFTNRDHGLHW